jgi:hypothetical protein
MKHPGLLAFVLITVLGVGSGVVLLGAERAMRITATTVLTELVDGQVGDGNDGSLPRFGIVIADSSLDALGRDLPWSGGEQHPAELHHAGRAYPVQFRYRGLVVTSHFLGSKKSFRVTFEGGSPFGRIRRMNFINPKTPDMLNVHMALWLARSMGAAVPFDDFAVVHMKGRALGVMEMTEQIDGSFEQAPEGGEVPVFKGDYPPAEGRAVPDRRALWKDAANWVFTGKADSARAGTRLRALVERIGADGDPDSVRAHLPDLLDVPLYLEYCAALQMMGTLHIDNYHNQWLVLDPVRNTFHPVMWDPLLLFPFDGEPWYPIHDALAFRVLSVPEWRLARDRSVWRALTALDEGGAFDRELSRMLDRIRPAVYRDREKCTGITDNNMDVFPYSLVQFAKAADHLREGMHAYWDRLERRCVVQDLRVERAAQGWHVRFTGPCALQVLWPDTARLLSPLPSNAWMENEAGSALLTIVPEVEQRGNGRGSAFADGTWYEPKPIDLVLVFDGTAPSLLQIRNAITGERLVPAP